MILSKKEKTNDSLFKKSVTDQRLFNLFRDVCETVAKAQPEDAHVYRRMADEPHHVDGFPVSAMIGAVVWDHADLFKPDVETVAYALRMIGGLADYRLPLMDKEPESDNCAPDGVGESNDET